MYVSVCNRKRNRGRLLVSSCVFFGLFIYILQSIFVESISWSNTHSPHTQHCLGRDYSLKVTQRLRCNTQQFCLRGHIHHTDSFNSVCVRDQKLVSWATGWSCYRSHQGQATRWPNDSILLVVNTRVDICQKTKWRYGQTDKEEGEGEWHRWPRENGCMSVCSRLMWVTWGQ